MNGQTLSYKEKQQIMDDYIAKKDPYQPLTPLQFDLRGYAAYIENNQVKQDDITEELMKRFVL